ncbi:MAG: von Willebrand factor type A domain-containing protein [Pirellula sp.]|jgi:Mg-chelatase subunit ChlD|nr:von Willebrand factor type A domain-containing protein [Pirellula sp.]
MMYDELDESIDPELQVRLLNLALGEASDFERDQLQMLMEQQPELLSHYRQLLHLHGLLRDVGLGDPIVSSQGELQDASWRLSEERRAKLLATLQSPALAPATTPSVSSVVHRPWWRLSRKRVIEIAALAACLLVFASLLLPAVQSNRDAARRFGMTFGGDSGSKSAASSMSTKPPPHGLSAVEPRFRNLMETQKPERFYDDISRGSDVKPTIDAVAPGSDSTRHWNVYAPESVRQSATPQGPLPSINLPSDPMAASSQWMDSRHAGGYGGANGLTEGLQENAPTRAPIVRGRGAEIPSIQPRFDNPDLASQPSRDNDETTLLFSMTPRIVIPAEEDFLKAREKDSKSIDKLSVREEEGKLGSLEQLGQAQPGKPQSGVYDNTARFKKLSDSENEPMQSGETVANFDSSAGNALGWYSKAQPSEKDFMLGTGLQNEPSLKRKLDRAPFEISPQREAASTFSLHVSDVSFKLAQHALAQGQLPDPSSIRIEEFVNAMDYTDPLPGRDAKVSCVVEQAIHPFRVQRNLLRVSLRTAAFGRSATTPLRLTILLDNSGSMERPDRRAAVLRAVQSLAQQLNANDQVTLIAFARTAHLLAHQVRGDQSGTLLDIVERLPSEGGTNLEAALILAREKALEQQTEGAQNRIILMTDGAVNLGNANPESLAQQIVQLRASGIALDVAGMGVRDLKDDLLEVLARQGDGRYYLLDTPESIEDSFANQIAGALRPTAMNVKVQVEFNPERVASYKLYGFDNHLLQAQDFRNDAVDAAELSAEEAGVAIYQFEPIVHGSGDVGSISVRFRDVASGEMIEHRWPIPYEPSAPNLETASPSMKLASATALFAAKLAGGPLADNVDLAPLATALATLPDSIQQHPRVQQLRSMMQSARDLQ